MVAAWTSGLENLAVNATQLLRYLAQRFDRLNMLGVRQCAGESGAQDGPGQRSRLRWRSPRVRDCSYFVWPISQKLAPLSALSSFASGGTVEKRLGKPQRTVENAVQDGSGLRTPPQSRYRQLGDLCWSVIHEPGSSVAATQIGAVGYPRTSSKRERNDATTSRRSVQAAPIQDLH
jgi:hypothetical protein